MDDERIELQPGCSKYTKGAKIKYIWNDKSCDGSIVYDKEISSLNAVSYVIEKNNALWDGNSPTSYSIGWSNIKREKIYPLGTPADKDFIEEMIIRLTSVMSNKTITDIKAAIAELSILFP